MDQLAKERQLTERAVQGDSNALSELLLQHHDRLLAYVRYRIPSERRSLIGAEDVVQETYMEVFRTIDRFQPGSAEAFYRWLAAIARQRLLDQVKALKRKKREGDRMRIKGPPPGIASTVASLMQVVAVDSHTPSRSAARRETAKPLSVALAGLKPEYRQALVLRYHEGLPVAEVARRMDRSDRAVHMLCYRGLARLREALGSFTKYLSS